MVNKTITGILCYAAYLIATPSHLSAQQNAITNQAIFNLFNISPASAGSDNDLVAGCSMKKNWTNIPGSPEVSQMNVHGSLRNQSHGLGLQITNETAGLFTERSLSANWRYRLQFTKNNFLSLALRAGFMRRSIDLSRAKAESPNEFANTSNQQSGFEPLVNAGLEYRFRNLCVFASAFNLINKTPYYNQSQYQQYFNPRGQENYLAGIKWVRTISKNLDLSGMIVGRSLIGLGVQPDFFLLSTYKKRLYAGIGFRPNQTVYGTSGLNINEKLQFLYSYEASVKTQVATRGGHEIGILFRIAKSQHEKK